MRAVRIPSFILCASLLALSAPAAQFRANNSSAASDTQQWTMHTVERSEAKDDAIGILREVRVGRHQGFDRVVFEFTSNRAVPTYRVEYISQPIMPGMASGEEDFKIAGKAFLDVHFDAFGHEPTTYELAKEPQKPLALRVIREIKKREDFENDMAYVLGLSARKPFRVMELSNPSRLVVDVKN